MSKKYRKFVDITKEVGSCWSCPNLQRHDGMGHCDDWECCGVNKKNLRYENTSFPKWCPLENWEEQDDTK